MLARLGRLLVLWLSIAAAAEATAASPWARLVPLRRVASDADDNYTLTDSQGPWMIMASTFSGEGAEEQARQLIQELRRDYKLPAYAYRKKFEYSKPVQGKGLTPQGEAPLMRYRRDEDVVEIAVLVGNYPSVDDPEAQRVLKTLKYAHPKSLEVSPDKSHQALAGYRKLQAQARDALFGKNEPRERGPMGNAFVVTNPLLPPEYFVPKGVDKLVVEMNREVPHSLLKCPEPYTVKVATFTGHAVILDPKRIEEMEHGKLPKSQLEAAAHKAHTLTEALRKKGYEAYEFHDRYSSIVTVGSFSSIGSKRPDGKIEINPDVHTIMKTFGAETKIVPGKEAEVGKPKKLGPIPFDVQPQLVEVPRMPVSSAYERTVTSR